MNNFGAVGKSEEIQANNSKKMDAAQKDKKNHNILPPINKRPSSNRT